MQKQPKVVKWLAMCLIALLVFQTPTAFANTLDDLKSKQQEVQQQKNELSTSIDKKSTEISAIEKRQNELLEQISALNTEIENTNKKINDVINEINVANQEIAKLEKEMAALQEKIDQRDALLRERARAIQSNGKVSYIDVLLGANSFIDFIDRFSAVNTLMEADRQIMREQKEDRQKLEDHKQLVLEKKKQLENNHAQLQSLKNALDAQKGEKNQLIDELEREQAKLKAEKQLLEKEYSEALTIDANLQKQIVAEQERLAEVARQQELERKRQEEQQRQAAVTEGNIPAVSAGTWTNPTTGRLTSGYGWRNIGFGSEFHYGIDVANSSGTPIVAAADGVVSYAAPLSSYGNVVIMTHSIEGQIFTTVYAHLSGFNVGVGSVVSKGQRIASMGSTGRSTGPHLHFEIHNGSWQGQSVGAINPLRYVSY